MNKEKWYKRDDVEYWKKEYLELSKQLEEKQIVLDKIKEYLKNLELGELGNGKPYTFIDFLKEEIACENEEVKHILELLEEIE